jgi:hypothetical protein
MAETAVSMTLKGAACPAVKQLMELFVHGAGEVTHTLRPGLSRDFSPSAGAAPE